MKPEISLIPTRARNVAGLELFFWLGDGLMKHVLEGKTIGKPARGSKRHALGDLAEKEKYVKFNTTAEENKDGRNGKELEVIYLLLNTLLRDSI